MKQNRKAALCGLCFCVFMGGCATKQAVTRSDPPAIQSAVTTKGDVASHNQTKPKVALFATGGTIAGAGQSSVGAVYQPSQLPVDKLVAAVPEIKDLAVIEGEQIAQIASQAMTSAVWLKLARRVADYVAQPDIAGVVITHGTDTLEETAYFLDLVIQTSKPIVLVGAMRASTSLSADGSLNLYNATALAADPAARDKGVLVVMNDRIHAAREVTKSHTSATDAFVSRQSGPLGRVEYGQVNFYRQPLNRTAPFDIRQIHTLPQVDILYGYANASAAPVASLLKSGAKGLVYAGVGNGNLFPAVEKALIAARQEGLFVVRSSRVGSGFVLRNAEVNDDENDFIVSNDLSPQKARILLMLALTQSDDSQVIQRWFYGL